MPVFDTPINTNDLSIDRVVSQKLPILMYLYRQPNAEIDAALSEMAKKHAGKLLVVRLHAGENPQTFARYKSMALPALVGLKNNEIQVQTAGVKPGDVSAHAAYLLGEGPKPAQPAPTTEPVKSGGTKANGAKSGTAKPANVTDSSFAKDVLQSKIPVLVDFWAAWCQPCHMVAPSVEKMAQTYAGKVKVVKVNVDDSPQTASRYQTFSIPTLILFKDGKEVNRLVGAHPLPAIDRLVQSALPQKHPAK